MRKFSVFLVEINQILAFRNFFASGFKMQVPRFFTVLFLHLNVMFSAFIGLVFQLQRRHSFSSLKPLAHRPESGFNRKDLHYKWSGAKIFGKTCPFLIRAVSSILAPLCFLLAIMNEIANRGPKNAHTCKMFFVQVPSSLRLFLLIKER
jgi:hypothetical protein